MKEKKSRVIQAHRMNAVIGSFDLTHFFEFICLAVADKLHNNLEEMLICINFFNNFIEENGILQVD